MAMCCNQAYAEAAEEAFEKRNRDIGGRFGIILMIIMIMRPKSAQRKIYDVPSRADIDSAEALLAAGLEES